MIFLVYKFRYMVDIYYVIILNKLNSKLQNI